MCRQRCSNVPAEAHVDIAFIVNIQEVDLEKWAQTPEESKHNKHKILTRGWANKYNILVVKQSAVYHHRF